MSWKVNIRKWWKRFRFDPYWRAAVEVGVTVIFTFLPLILLSTPIIQGGQEISRLTVFGNLATYLDSGELVLPTLGLCGTLYAVVILNKELLRPFMMVLYIIIPAIIVMGGGYILGMNKGFAGELQEPAFAAVIIAYFVTTVFWFFLSVRVSRGVDRPEPEERANVMLAGMKARKSAGGRS